MNSLVQILQGIIVIFFIVFIVVYILQALLLSGLNKKMYGKGTILAWIPVCNTYLLGKLVVNKGCGFILILWSFASTALTFMSATAFFTNAVGQTTTPGMISPTIATGVSFLYNLTTFVLFIIALVKFFTYKKQNVDESISYQPVSQPVESNNDNQVILPTSEERPVNNYYVNNQPTTYEDLFVEKVEELSPEEQQKQEEIPDLGIFNQSADMLIQNQEPEQNNSNNNNNPI